jgi:hypothetical protein
MRGKDSKQSSMLCLISPADRVPKDHPLRPVKVLADQALAGLSRQFDAMYSRVGRPSIPPERLLKSMLLTALYSLRSERQFCEQLDYNLLFCWFLDNPFAKPATRVDYMVVGIPGYDTFFKDAATLNGTVVLSNVVLNQTDVFIAQTKKAGAGNALSPIQLKRINEQQKRTDSLIALLTDLPARSQKLLSTGDALQKSAGKTIIGPNAVKLPGVTKGLSDAMGDIKNAAAKSPSVLDHARKTSASLAGLQ